MTSEMGEMFNDWKKAKQEKRAENRANSAKLLTEYKVPFTEKNNGAHLVIQYKDHIVDFWPGTGKWVFRRVGKWGRGVFKLLHNLGAMKEGIKPNDKATTD